MRVITGEAKGKRIAAPEGRDVRPTPERVKEGIFSAIQFDVEGRRVLDLFAGSGQLGIEALSRGAKSAVFVDNSAASVKLIKKNLQVTGLEGRATVYQGDYSSYAKMCKEQFDIAFLDPPYAAGLLSKALEGCVGLMSDYGVIFCEHPSEVELEQKIGEFSLYRRYRYGKIFVSCYRKEASE